MFIQCKNAVCFKNGNDKVVLPNQYVGSIPDWVSKTWYFEMLVKDGTITFIGNGTDKEIDKAEEVAKEKKEVKEKVAEEKRAEDKKSTKK